MSNPNTRAAFRSEDVVTYPERDGDEQFLNIAFRGVLGFLRVGPCALQPRGDDWQFVRSGNIIELDGMFLDPDAPRGTGTQLYQIMLERIRTAGFEYVASQIHSVRILSILQRFHGDAPVIVPCDLLPPIDKDCALPTAEILAGDYGKGIALDAAKAYLQVGAGTDDFNPDRYVVAVSQL